MSRISVTGIYSLNDREHSMLIAGQDEHGEIYGEVPIRLVSNSQDGLPEKLWLRFYENEREARLLADRPNVPIQITVEYETK